MGLPAIPAVSRVPGTPRGPRRGLEGTCAGVPVVWEGREGDEGGAASAGDSNVQTEVEQEEGQHAATASGGIRREGCRQIEGEEAVGILGVGGEAAAPDAREDEGEGDEERRDRADDDGAEKGGARHGDQHYAADGAEGVDDAYKGDKHQQAEAVAAKDDDEVADAASASYHHATEDAVRTKSADAAQVADSAEDIDGEDDEEMMMTYICTKQNSALHLWEGIYLYQSNGIYHCIESHVCATYLLESRK